MSSRAYLNNLRYHFARVCASACSISIVARWSYSPLQVWQENSNTWRAKVHTSQLAWNILDLCGADANKLACFPEERPIYFYVTICLSGKIFIPLIWWTNGCDIHLACDVSVTGTLYSQNNGFRSCTIFERFLSNGFCSKLNWCNVANLTFIFLPRNWNFGYSNLAKDRPEWLTLRQSDPFNSNWKRTHVRPGLTNFPTLFSRLILVVVVQLKRSAKLVLHRSDSGCATY